MAPRPQPRRTAGRPKIIWEPWLAKMHDYVLAGETVRRASDLVAQVYRDEIPQGSTHGQRRDESTARLLRKYYPDWLMRQAEREELQATLARMCAMVLGEEGSQWRRADVLARISHASEVIEWSSGRFVGDVDA